MSRSKPTGTPADRFVTDTDSPGCDDTRWIGWKRNTSTLRFLAMFSGLVSSDPESGSAEWLAEFRSDISDFVPREIVEAAIVPGRHEMPRLSNRHYHGFVDPSGGSSDSMTLAISHKENDKLVLDVLRERRPPFSPQDVVEEFVTTLRD